MRNKSLKAENSPRNTKYLFYNWYWIRNYLIIKLAYNVCETKKEKKYYLNEIYQIDLFSTYPILFSEKKLNLHKLLNEALVTFNLRVNFSSANLLLILFNSLSEIFIPYI